MSLVKHTTSPLPWHNPDAVGNRMNRVFGDLDFGNLTDGSDWAPPESVEERNDDILLTELPGMTEDQVEISLENNVLTISGEKREEGEAGGELHLVERGFGSFRRSFTLPRAVRAEGIAAEFDNGLLSVRLPKVGGALIRKIEVSRKSR